MNYLMCDKCFEIYNTDKIKNQRCPKYNCEGTLFTIDELIMYAIQILNRKNYFTTYCCSGHYHELDGINSYVYFVNKLTPEIRIPEGWEIDSKNKKIIRYDREISDNLKFYHLAIAMESLLDWAKKLPNRGYTYES